MIYGLCNGLNARGFTIERRNIATVLEGLRQSEARQCRLRKSKVVQDVVGVTLVHRIGDVNLQKTIFVNIYIYLT